MQIISLYLNLQHGLLIYAIAYARLAIVFYLLPILGERVLSNLIIKNSTISLTIIGLWPCFEQVTLPEQRLFILLIKESVVGLILAVSLSIPFWIVAGLGEILDNQRGASMGESIDPLHNGQSSILSAFMNFAFCVIFFENDGMLFLLDAMVKSYHIFPSGTLLVNFHWLKVGELLVLSVETSMMIAAPVIIVLIVAEILLGIFSRYCPQLNPFSLSLTIKSFITFLVFLFYGFNTFKDKSFHLFRIDFFSDMFS